MKCLSASQRSSQAIFLSIAVVACACLPPSSAAPMIDQSHIITQSVGGLITVAEFTPAQTFTVGQTGKLAQIDVQIGRDTGADDDLMLEIWSTTSGAPSGTAPLFATTIPASTVPVSGPGVGLPFTSVDVTAADLSVIPGDVYAVAVRGTPDFDEPDAFWNWGRPGYSGGDAYATAFGRPWEVRSTEYDFGFRTWVDPNPAATQTIELMPLFDAMAERTSEGQFEIDEFSNSIFINRSDLDTDQRGLFEFDLSSIPSNATIRSASLQLDMNVLTYAEDDFPIVGLYGYAGDGQPHPSDATHLDHQLGASAPLNASDPFEIDIDVAALTDLRLDSQYLGVVGYQENPPNWVGVVSSEFAGEFPEVFRSPKLSITFETPPTPPRRPGDYNGNGLEDAADYVVWRKTLGQSGGGLPADGNGDGSVDPLDHGFWRKAFVSPPAAAVRNGDFSAGNLSHWDVVEEPNTDVSFGFPRVEPFDVDGDGTADDAMRIRVGRINASLDEGGKAGIEQEIVVFDLGDYTLSADFASASFQDFGNTAPGRFELFFDGTLVDYVDLNGTLIDGFEVIRGELEAQLLDVAIGYHTVRLLVHRPGTNSREIYGYFDNVGLVPNASAGQVGIVPEPSTAPILLAAIGCTPVTRCRRRSAWTFWSYPADLMFSRRFASESPEACGFVTTHL